MHTSCLIFIAVIVSVNGDKPWPKIATCKFTKNIKGAITLTQESFEGPVKVEGKLLSGFRTGVRHGLHVHEFGDLSEKGCESVGTHYQPHGQPHGAPSDSNRHVGDLGNINTHSKGGAEFTISDYYLKLCGPFSIFGRSIVIHEREDDLGKGGNSESKLTGNAGKPLDCCVIVHPFSPNTMLPFN